MIYYFFYTGTYLLGLLKKNRKIESFWILMVGLFLTTTYMNGSDWRQYEIFYKYLTINNFSNYWHEKGFAFYALLSKLLINDFWIFFIITKILVLIVFYKTINKYSKNKMFVLSLFIPIMGLYLFIDAPFRNLIAIGIYLLSIKYIEKKEFKYYLILVFIASFFHKSVFLMLILYFLDFTKLNRKKTIVIIFICFFILSNPDILKYILIKSPFFQEKINSYILGNSQYAQGSFFSLGNLEKIFVVYFVLKNKEKILRQRHGKIIYNFFMIGIIIYKFAVTIEILSRFLLYINLFYILMIDLLVSIASSKNKKLIFIFIYFYGALLMSMKLNHYAYRNYNSYIFYVLKDKKNFKERSNFNLERKYKEPKKWQFFKGD